MPTQENCPQWATDLLGCVNKKWQEISKACPDAAKNGYAVFYGPVPSQCDLMIIGFNPGGSSKNFQEMDAPPAKHDYACMKYALAKKMRDIFIKIGAKPLLVQSVKTNLNFFRSKNLTFLNQSYTKELRKELEEFSIDRVNEIIGRLKPKVIITEGIGVFDRLIGVFDRLNCLKKISKDDYVEVEKDKNRRLYAKATWRDSTAQGKVTLIGLIHPTGSRVAADKWETIISLLKDDLKTAGLL